MFCPSSYIPGNLQIQKLPSDSCLSPLGEVSLSGSIIDRGEPIENGFALVSSFFIALSLL